ncbi:hypothetical protein [Phenylobacterium sp.]|jgi:hypothetical protein|uniref:hypothetical protein n=1 Tax=Phenylobacterium sp. TaxID=1871053 RepID=UPI002F3FF5FD
MVQRPTTLERAFELARSGDHASPETLRRQLAAEGYHDARAQVSGRSLRGQLMRLCAEAMANKPANDPASPPALQLPITVGGGSQ